MGETTEADAVEELVWDHAAQEWPQRIRMDHLDDTERIRQRCQLVSTAFRMNPAFNPHTRAILTIFVVNHSPIGFRFAQIKGPRNAVLVGKDSKRSLPSVPDNQLIDRQAIKIEGEVKSGDEGISKQMITAFGKYRIEDFQDTIDPGNTQNGGVKFKSIIAKAGEPWSGLDQKTTGE